MTNRAGSWAAVTGRVALLLLAGLARAAGLDLAEGFTAEVVCDGITGATGMAVVPDGRVFICEQTGALRVLKNGRLLESPVLELPVDSRWERGLLGVSVAPDFPAKPVIYVLWTAADPHPHHRLSAFPLKGDVADSSDEQLLIEGDNQDEMPGSVKAGHQGGGLGFGPDGKLYAGIGEQTAGLPSQNLNSLLGKIIRLNTDGTIPVDNPFAAKTTGKYRAIWARGLRNPWALAFEPGGSRLFINDIGASAFEEINEGVAGGNYGWPMHEGESGVPGSLDPILQYGRSEGQSLGGGCFYPRVDQRTGNGKAWFPDEYAGRYFFQDYMAGWMHSFDPARPRQVHRFASGLSYPTAVAVAPDGALLVLERNLWVKDDKFREKSGRLIRILPAPKGAPPVAVAPTWPPLLSAAGIFASLHPLKPAHGTTACEVRVPYWEPGVRVQRWWRLSAGDPLTIDDAGEFVFPPGTVLVRHLDSPGSGRPILTSLIAFTAGGRRWAATYRWRADASDAELVRDGGLLKVDGRLRVVGGPVADLAWPPVVPGYANDIVPGNLVSPAVSDVCATAPAVPAWSRLEDSGRPAEARARAWLDVNCSACHRPGSIGRAAFDLRYGTSLPQAGLINGPLLAATPTVAAGPPATDARVIVPGQPELSMLYLRLLRPSNDPLRMPPACPHPEQPPAAALLREWISAMK